MPWDYMGSGGDPSGFSSNEDGATANLNINMSDDDARTLWDVQAAVQQIATDFQTAVRAASDFHSYLISIRETSSTLRIPNLGMEGDSQGNLPYAGGRVDTTSRPPATSGESNMIARMGEMAEAAEGLGVSGGALEAASEGGRVAGPLAGGGGNLLGEATNLLFLGQQLNQAAGGRGQISQANAGNYRSVFDRELALGRTPAQAAATAQNAIAGVQGINAFLRGGGVGALGMLSRAGVWGAVAYGGAMAVNEVAETYARSRAMGIASGSGAGAGWGFGQLANQQFLALSPFVSSQEAAEIYSTAIDQGWANNRSGATFGQATDFLYTGARDYNMSISDSAQLLNENVGKAGQSIEDLSQQLLTLKQSAEGSGIALAPLVRGVMQTTSTFINRGGDPSQAFLAANGSALAFAGNPILRDSGNEIFNQLLGSQTATAIVASRMGVLPWSVGGEGTDLFATSDEYWNLISESVKRIEAELNAGRITAADANGRLAAYINARLGTNFSPFQAKGFRDSFAAGVNPFREGLEQATTDAKATLEERSNWDLYTESISEQAEGGWMAKLSYAHTWFSQVPSLFGATEDNVGNATRWFSPEVEDVFRLNGGPANFEIVDKATGRVIVSGDDIRQWIGNRQNFDRFVADDFYLRNKTNGMQYYGSSIGAPGNAASATGSTNISGTLTVNLTGTPIGGNNYAIEGTGSSDNTGVQ